MIDGALREREGVLFEHLRKIATRAAEARLRVAARDRQHATHAVIHERDRRRHRAECLELDIDTRGPRARRFRVVDAVFLRARRLAPTALIEGDRRGLTRPYMAHQHELLSLVRVELIAQE